MNADKAIFTGKKMQEKIYYRHMGKPGNLRESTPEEKKEIFGGAELVWKAVSGMLPKNKLRKVCCTCRRIWFAALNASQCCYGLSASCCVI